MIDLAKIQVKAGKGGDGAVSFRREKYIAKGGPDGGDGGKGGSVFAVCDHNLATLKDYRTKRKYKAKAGTAGMGKNQKGGDSDDVEIRVPVGTLIYEIKDGEEILIADMHVSGERILLAKGGRGGVGNWHFKSSTNQTPKQYTKGKPGEEKGLKLEVKLIADVGLVGAPNAGKSTLVNKLTNANAKVASYPFTTLSPNLGVLELKSGETVVISDIPGLIEGASDGKGLGDEFLRHVERTRLLIHVVDVYEEGADLVENAVKRYEMIQQELRDYKADLSEKAQIVVVNKIDITEVSEAFEAIQGQFKSQYGVEVLGISAVTGEGLDALVNKVTLVLSEVPKKTEYFEKKTTVKLYTIDNLPNKRMVYGTSEVLEME